MRARAICHHLYSNQPRYLDVRYIPETLQGRERERSLLEKRILRPLARGDIPRNQLLFGPTGSGKTVCVRQILTEIPPDVLKCYLIADMSVYQILKSIAGEFGADITELNIHTNEYLEAGPKSRRRPHGLYNSRRNR